jgi:origin recognition complex subunit 4
MRGVSDVNSHMEDVDDLPQYAMDFRKICQDHALESQLSVLSHIILEQLTSKRRIPLLGLDDAYLKVHQVVRQTVVAGEGNSMLILGARGTGKTALVETVISDLAKDYEDDFHVIRLNGFIHTDDRLALKEIWKQLGREMETGDEIAGNSISYADTLSSLLALLSHPEELSGEETDAAAKSVIFVMDEFDLFASHPRQTLLYNLFDISQAKKAPIAVLGLSTKVDVSESLEKRVKSRFSHRYVHLPMSKNLKTFEAICKAGLEVQDTDKSRFGGDEGQMLLHGWSQLLKVCINLSNSKTWSVLLMPSGRVGAF